MRQTLAKKKNHCQFVLTWNRPQSPQEFFSLAPGKENPDTITYTTITSHRKNFFTWFDLTSTAIHEMPVIISSSLSDSLTGTLTVVQWKQTKCSGEPMFSLGQGTNQWNVVLVSVSGSRKPAGSSHMSLKIPANTVRWLAQRRYGGWPTCHVALE